WSAIFVSRCLPNRGSRILHWSPPMLIAPRCPWRGRKARFLRQQGPRRAAAQRSQGLARCGAFRLRHPDRKQPPEPQHHTIKHEEKEEADITTKLALDNEPDQIVREGTPIMKINVVGDQQHDALA